MISYWMFSFKMQVAIVKELERMFSNFLWHRNMHSWKWDSIYRPKPEGGLGIRRVSHINNASGIRLAWRMCTSSALGLNG